MPPSAFLLRKKKKQRHWEIWDYGLAEAIHTIDSEKCRKCGTDAAVAFNEDQNIEFDIDEHVCHACAHLEQHDDAKSDKDPKKFGVTEFVKAEYVDFDESGKAVKADVPADIRQRWLSSLHK